MKTQVPHERLEALYKAIVAIESREDCVDFLEDLCTPQEVENLAQRLWAAKLIMDGMTYKEVAEQMDISSATICKVARCVKYGKGYKKFRQDG